MGLILKSSGTFLLHQFLPFQVNGFNDLHWIQLYVAPRNVETNGRDKFTNTFHWKPELERPFAITGHTPPPFLYFEWLIRHVNPVLARATVSRNPLVSEIDRKCAETFLIAQTWVEHRSLMIFYLFLRPCVERSILEALE